MGKKSRVKARSAGSPTPSGAHDASAEVGPRQPCPCGSGRRYKACHGSASGPPPTFVARPFEGLPGECDLIAMREIIPAATAPVGLREGVADGDRAVQLCSLLPMAAPALSRADGGVWLGLQVQHGFGDPSRDLAAVLLKALASEPGAGVVGLTDAPGEGPRLQDLLVDQPLEVTVHDGFDYWVAGVDDPSGETAASLESANAAVNPSSRLSSVEAAYWTDVGNREHLRWVMPYDEEPLLDALARLHVAGADTVAEGSRFVGMFRAHGRLVPVWDLPSGTGAEALEEPAARFGRELADTLADGRRLTSEERAARNGLANRQLTIR
jgi:uncharacterized protein DUF5926/SEC-C motif-containing protein